MMAFNQNGSYHAIHQTLKCHRRTCYCNLVVLFKLHSSGHLFCAETKSSLGIGWIHAPSSTKHDQDLIVLSGDTGNVLAFGPGYNVETNYPGHNGTTLISGHRDTHFRFLQEISIGDEFKLDSILDNNDYIYEVSNIKIIDSDQQDISTSNNQSELKLVTCYPFNALIAGGSLRYVVTAALVLD